MDVRIIVPIKWDSPVRQEIFQILQSKGYTWSRGNPLLSNQDKARNMIYFAIYVNSPIVTWGSKTKLIDCMETDTGFNYKVISPTTNRVMQAFDFMKYCFSDLDENIDKLRELIRSHYEIQNQLVLL